VPGVSAATILGDGSVALILDVADMHRLGQSKKENPVFGAQTRARSVEELEPS
jgi:two-component system chemotaxis sensor kinase CheA